MDSIDATICHWVQEKGKMSSAELAEVASVSVSTANERLRRLVSSGVIQKWQAVLDPEAVNIRFGAMLLLTMDYPQEAEALEALKAAPEIQEIHHISGPHSYLLKVRVTDTRAFQQFLQQRIKPLKAVRNSETLVIFDTLKETSALHLVGANKGKEG